MRLYTHTHGTINLINGDCYEKLKEIPDKSIDLIVIDPPYLITTTGGGIYKQKDKGYVKQLDLIKDGIDESVLEDLCRVLKKINIYIWCSKKQIYSLLRFFKAKKCNYDLLVWHKSNPLPACNNKYLTDTEYLLFFRETGVKIFGSFKTKFTYYITTLNTKDKKLWQHPTIKPLEIIKNLIINSSNEGDTVLDCFMGSGTTGVACKQLNRNFIGIEIDEKYYNIAKERIENANSNTSIMQKQKEQ